MKGILEVTVGNLNLVADYEGLEGGVQIHSLTHKGVDIYDYLKLIHINAVRGMVLEHCKKPVAEPKQGKTLDICGVVYQGTFYRVIIVNGHMRACDRVEEGSTGNVNVMCILDEVEFKSIENLAKGVN